MKLRRALRQFRQLIPVLLAGYVPALALVGVLAVVHYETGVPYQYFFVDPAAGTPLPFLRGLVSNVGILLWSASAAICVFTFLVMTRQKRRTEEDWFFLSLGGIASLLLFDDFFLVHETVGQYFTGAYGIADDIGENAVFTLYVVLVAAFLFRYKAIISSTEYLLLGLAILFLAGSAIGDAIAWLAPGSYVSHEVEDSLVRLFVRNEDVLKLLGIVSWFTYAVRSSLRYASQPPPPNRGNWRCQAYVMIL